MKKIIGVTLAVLLVMTALCSCGSDTTGTDENGNIKDTEDAVDDALTDDKTDNEK